jgi:hydroxypyruvate isomerase
MPRFSANLGFLWPDRPLVERIDAAARAGFKAIELHWPYDVPASAVHDRCARHGLTLLGINTVRGNVPRKQLRRLIGPPQVPLRKTR